jgi:hypothetical protein
MQAIHYIDQFMRKNSHVEECTLRLIGMAAIIIAAKVNENVLLNLDAGERECNYEYDMSMIAKTERMMLLLLNFHTDLPTVIDFLQLFLYLSQPNFDFSELIIECLSLAYFSLLGKKFKRYINF